jgi:hypothetical protein
MTTKILPSTLTLTVVEAITLNGQAYGASNSFTIANVVEIDKRIVEVPTSEIVVLAFASGNPAAGSFDEDDVRYIRITNLDDTNFVQIIFRSAGNAEFAIKLDAGESFIYTCDNAGGVGETMDASASALSSVTFEDLVDITALANGAAVDLELFVAGV